MLVPVPRIMLVHLPYLATRLSTAMIRVSMHCLVLAICSVNQNEICLSWWQYMNTDALQPKNHVSMLAKGDKLSTGMPIVVNTFG